MRRVEPMWSTAAADEVDDLEAVAVFERRLRPGGAGDYLKIEFDGDTVGLGAEFFDERCEGRGRGGAELAVEGDGHAGSW